MTVNLFARYEDLLRSKCAALAGEGVLPQGIAFDRVTVEEPREAAHGDLATNAAMVLAKPANLKPRELAETLAARLSGEAGIVAAEVAGPGFINLRLADSVWHDLLREVVVLGEDYGRADIGAGTPVNVEYVSVNPTGPLHVGHCRGAVFGDALANLLEFTGWKVSREYYINDAGAQIETLARSTLLRYREALGEDIGEIPAGLYPADYLVPVGERLAREHGPALLDLGEAEQIAIVGTVAVEAMMEKIRDDLATLAIRHDVFFSERSLTQGGEDRAAVAIGVLTERGLIYEGRLPPPKGKLPDDWEDREQTLFRSTEFGDDVDRALRRSDGNYTYFASDIAYHFDKFSRGFVQMIDVWGADHGGYVKRIMAAVEALTGGHAELDIKLCQLVRLFRAGEPVKMSKRAGDFVTLRETVDEVGPDAVRFIMLYRKNDAPLDFDFARVTEQSRDNPVFYVQYAHARIASVLRNAEEAFTGITARGALADAPIEQLTDAGELQLIKRLAQYPRLVEAAARAHEPHRLAFYLHELASDFHGLWNRGKELPHLRFIHHDRADTTKARLALVNAVAYVLRSGLGVLGVGAPDEME